MKKETLKEAFDRIFDSIDYTEFDYTSFEQGAKWQQERSCSDEEVINILVEFSAEIKKVWNITEWFNKFRKK